MEKQEKTDIVTKLKPVCHGTWKIGKIVFGECWRFCQHFPAYYESARLFFRGAHAGLSARWNWVKNIALALLFLSLAGAGFFLYQEKSRYWLDEETQALLIQAEACFAQGRYEKAHSMYESILKKKSDLRFLGERISFASYFGEIANAIRKGDAKEVDRLVLDSQNEKWEMLSRSFFNEHLRNFVPQIERIKGFEEDIQNLVLLLKEGKKAQAEETLKRTLLFAKRHGTSLEGLKKKILEGIEHEISDMLVMAWRHRKELGIGVGEIQACLGEGHASQMERVQKLLGKSSLEVAEVLSFILPPRERLQIAKRYLANRNEEDSDHARNIQIALHLDRGFSEAHFQRGVLDVLEGNHASAIQNYDRAHDTYTSLILCARGWSRFAQHQYIVAVKEWQESLQRVEGWPSSTRPHVSSSHLGLGIFYFLLQNMRDAKYHIDKARENRLPEAETMTEIMQGSFASLEGFDGPSKGYLELCQGIQLAGVGRGEEGLKQIDRARTTLSKYKILPIEVLLHEAVILKRLEREKEAEEKMRELSSFSDLGPSVLFLSLLYMDQEERDRRLKQMDEEWQNFCRRHYSIPFGE